MAVISDSVKQIKASVLELAESSGNRDAFVLQWNTLIDESIASINAAQVSADKYLAMDKRAYGLLASERDLTEGALNSVSASYSKLAVELSKHEAGGHDILSVLGTYAGMKSGPYCAAVVVNNRYARMAYNLERMERESLIRERDLETLAALKI